MYLMHLLEFSPAYGPNMGFFGGTNGENLISALKICVYIMVPFLGIALWYLLKSKKADKIYNELIDYIGAENHTNDLTQFNLNQCEQSKEYYSQAKDYYRLSLDYDETPSESTKAYKKKMR